MQAAFATKISNVFRCAHLCVLIVLGFAATVHANIPGGGTGTGPNVTLTDSGSTVAISNGIVSILCTKSGGTINQINYTYNNSGTVQTANLLSGGNNGGQLYWENSNNQGLSFTYSLVANPATNGGNYAEIMLTTLSESNSVLEVHYSLLRGASGFYVTAIWYHRSVDLAWGMGECRDNIYAGSTFNWMSVDATRNKLMPVSGGSAIGVNGAPVEVSLWTNGIYAGQYEDKYKFSSMLGVNHVWGWSSVGSGHKNVGLWNITASSEYYNGGPLKRELIEHMGTTILNMLNGGHYGMGGDGNFANNEVWTKVCGPYFIYCNNITNTITATNAAAQALYADAIAQQAAEAGAWPYSWFNNTNYTSAANRGTVNGKFVINDSGNPNASAAKLWVGLVQQPSTTTSTYDFQAWAKPFQFWTTTDSNGNFTLPDVIAGGNYTLYAYGPGAPGEFMSQLQTGGNPPLLYNLPLVPFSVTVPANGTNNLGTITWTPTRVAPTVFEIGYPDRTSAKFRHGDDWWVGDMGPSSTVPSPIWSKWLEYPFDFPNGLNYTVGQSRWTTDWNFVQPVVRDSQGNYNNSSSTITFYLASAPAVGSTASLYLGLSSDYYAAIIVTVNGNNLGSVSGVTGTPNSSIPTTGYYPGYSASDTTVREGNQAMASDERINFPGSQLHAGWNTINIGIRQIGGSYFSDHAMYDYVRLELTGYVPPAPANVVAFPGNNCNLITWPVTPGATSYNILRSTTSGSGYVSITNGVVGPVCGSGTNNAVYVDTTAVNGTTYYYVVQSANPTGTSANSPQSSGTAPSGSISVTVPAAPSVTVSNVGHQSVTLTWNAVTNANFYSVYRTTWVSNGGGESNLLNTIILNNAITNTTYTDTSPTDGTIHRYFVTATSAAGTSTNSSSVNAKPVPTTPTTPSSLTASFVYSSTTNITLNWLPVPGAVGYVISRATSAAGPYVYLQTVTMTTYTDTGLNPAVIYYYRVAAMNAGGSSGNNTDSVNSQQSYPTNLTASATNAQVILSWSSVSNATSYTVKRGTSIANETVTVVSGYTGTSYTNSGLANGTTYYYVVTATGAGGTSGNSPEASATPLAIGNGIWVSPADGNWSTVTNWNGGSIASGAGNTADFSTLSLSSNVTVTLDSPRTISGLTFGDTTSSYDWTVAGTNLLTLSGNPIVNVVNRSASVTVPLGGTSGLTKIGAGSLIVRGPTNSLTGGITNNAGVLALDFTATNSPVSNLVSTANYLAIGGGTSQIIGSSNTSSAQTFAGTVLNPGASTISAAPLSGTTLPVVNLAGVTPRAGGVVKFIGPATIGAGGAMVNSNAILASTASGNNSFVGGNGSVMFDANFATVGLYDLAATVGAISPYTIVGGSQIAGFYTTTSGTAGTGGNLDVVGNITGWSAQPYLTSLRFNSNIGANISVAATGNGSTVTFSDILVTPNVGAYNVSFNSGALRPAGGSTSYAGPYVIWQNNTSGQLILNSTLGNSKIAGATYVQSGPGTVSITGTASGYSGQSYLNGGATLIAGNGSIGAASTGAAVNLNGGALVANGTFALENAGANLRPITLLANGGALGATAGNTLTVNGIVGSETFSGPLTIGIPSSAANSFTAGLLPGTGAGTANTTPVYATGTVTLTAPNTFTSGTILQSGTLNINGIYALGGANYGGLTFNGGTLQYAASFPGTNGSADLTSIGTAGITVAAGGGTIDLNGNAITYAGSIGNGGTGSLLVKSSLPGGSLTLPGANNYSGNTAITNATLVLNNSSGSATGSGNLTVQNLGILTGPGSLDGSVSILSGGSIAPGGFNVLDVGGDLTLSAGSSITLRLQHSPATNAAINVSGMITEGGTLVVTNAGPANFTAGDRFQLLNGTDFANSFANVVLPSLGNPSLSWSTSQLNVDGSLWVVSTTPTTISQTTVANNNLVLAGNGGTPNWIYYVLGSTNLALPIAQWTTLATNNFDPSGNFAFSNALDSNVAQLFLRIQAQ